jgi:membrane associated rhomboid family serine protease
VSYYRSSNYNYYRPSLFGGFKFFPPVIKALLISNVAVFLLADILARFTINGVPIDPYIAEILFLFPLGNGFHVWQLFTYMFMHGGVTHLLFNMFALWMFGMELENEWGSRKFLLYYMICGLGAGLSNLFIGPLFTTPGPTVGASGAIYGVLIAFGIMYPDRPIFMFFLPPIRAKYFVTFYILLELYSGIASTADNVAHFAHLGGAAVGLIFLMIDQDRIPFKRFWMRSRPRILKGEQASRFSAPRREEITDASYKDIEESDIDQKRIDAILDKISQHGYQSLSEDEKRVLFDASKRLN